MVARSCPLLVALKRGEFRLARAQVRAIEKEQKQYNVAALGPDSVADRVKASRCSKPAARLTPMRVMLVFPA